MASTWDIISSAFVLILFLAAAYGVSILTRSLSTTSESTRTSLQQKGVNYQNGRLSVKTDRAAPTRDQYIAQTQRAFEKGGRMMSQHPDAFKVGQGEISPAAVEGKSSGVETPEKKGFQRSKKLA